MPNVVNRLLLQEYKQAFSDAENFVTIGYEGLEANDTHALRDDLAKNNIPMLLVKNRIAALAFDELGKGDIKEICSDQTGIASGEDPVALARFFVDLRKANDKIKIHGAIVEGQILDEKDVVTLSKSPNKEELKSIISGQALSPGAKLSGALIGPGGLLAGQIKSMIEKREEAGEA
jgi:large subunit ribosomal protein L10